MCETPSKTPMGIFARIESLKKWQIEQQQRLREQQSQQSEFLTSEHKRMYHALGLEIPENRENTSRISPNSNFDHNNEPLSAQFDSELGVSMLEYHDEDENETDSKYYENPEQQNTSKSPENMDELPIKSPQKNFIQLLEEQLKCESVSVVENVGKPKKPFLKRGEGLSRFRMTINDLAHKKPLKNTKLPKNKRPSTRSIEVNLKKSVPKKTTKAPQKNNGGVIRNSRGEHVNAKQSENQAIPRKIESKTASRRDSSTNHLSQSKSTNQVSSQLSLTNQVSFQSSSTNHNASSSHRTLLTTNQNAPFLSESNYETSSDKDDEQWNNENVRRPYERNSRDSCVNDMKMKVPLEARFNEHEKNSVHFKDLASSLSLNKSAKTINDREIENLSAIEDKLQEYKLKLGYLDELKLSRNDMQSPESPIEKNGRLKQTRYVSNYRTPIKQLKLSPIKAQLAALGFKTPNKSDISSDFPMDVSEGQREFERELLDELKIFEMLEMKAENSSFCSTSSLVTKLMGYSVESTPKKIVPEGIITSRVEEETDNSGSDSSSVTSEDISEQTWREEEEIVSSQHETTLEDTMLHSQKKKISTSDAATNTDPIKNPPINSELLKSRLEQLENEIEIFRKENSRISKIKSELEAESRDLKKRRKLLEEETEEQRRDLEEDRKKLARDKTLHERYIKELKNKPNKKEREGITLLQSQLSSIKEELKLKESRYGAAQARFRNQVKQLEKQNASLKIENEELRKKNGKLKAMQKTQTSRRPSDTKMLHEINKNLSKLAQEGKIPKKSPEGPKQEKSKKQIIVKKKVETPLESASDEDSSEDEHSYFQNKENNLNSLNCTVQSNDSSRSRSLDLDPSFDSIERDYEKMFGAPKVSLPMANASSIDDSYKKDREEKILEDGSKQITYSNGNIKTVSPGGNLTIMKYYNGDIKETCSDTGTIKYWYSEAKTTHTTYPDGTELLEFPNGQIEKRFKDGSTEVHFPNGCRRCTTTDGVEEVIFPDGTVVVNNIEGERVLTLPNGQKEIHTHDHKRREYPDGTVKLLYPDGVQETRYANGRIRLKDKDGNLIMDSGSI